MTTIDIRKKYLALEKRLKELKPDDHFSDIVFEELDLLQELQKIIISKDLPIKSLEELGELTNRINLLFSEKAKEQRAYAESKKVVEKSQNGKKAN